MNPLVLLGLISAGASLIGNLFASRRASQQQQIMEDNMQRQVGTFQPTVDAMLPLFNTALRGLTSPVSSLVPSLASGGTQAPNIDWNNITAGINLPSAPNVNLGDITGALARQFSLLQSRATANAAATAAAAGLSGSGLEAAADMAARSQIAGQIAEQLVAWERQKPELALRAAALNLDSASRAYELGLRRAGMQLSEWQALNDTGLRAAQMEISKNLAVLQSYLQAQQQLANIWGGQAAMRGDLSREAMNSAQGSLSWLPIAIASGLFK